jgi:glycosyltransferase involved in cell wall biosynthesis/beta-glucosidase/6-phospho-beta-glucosidase/beta-galactosidase
VGAGSTGSGGRGTQQGLHLIAGFESTYSPLADLDCFDTSGHGRRWRADLDEVRSSGVDELRYPLLWHRIETEPGRYDWRATDTVLGHLRDAGLRPVVDLVHHTSYPAWLTEGFADPRFGPGFERFALAVAERYPWLEAYTLFNEPFATLFLAGHEALWPPYGRGAAGLVPVLRSVLPAVLRAGAAWRELLPAARHVWVDTCEHHAGGTASGRAQAELANDRRFALLDLALGERLDERRPFLRLLAENGGADLLGLAAQAPARLHVDVVGLDYYVHSEWWYDDLGGHAPSPFPVGFAALARQYAEHYGRPLMLSETNIRGLPTDQVTWLRYMAAEYERAVAQGVPLDGFCWFPHVDSCDWDSLLARGGAGRRDPVGVLALGSGGSRTPTALTRAWHALARGARAAELPAYRPQSPVREQLAAYSRFLAGWPWVEPPAADVVDPLVLVPETAVPVPVPPQPSQEDVVHVMDHTAVPRPAPGPDLVVLSHLRWQFVWQRPQHLLTRITAARAGDGGRTWFVEEPHATPDADAPRLATEQHGDITRVWLEVPVRDGTPEGRLDFAVPAAQDYAQLLTEMLAHDAEPAGPKPGPPKPGAKPAPHVWLYTPMALDIAEALEPDLLVYDVMDDLAAFAKAPAGLRLRQRRALRLADVVLAGGRSLHASVAARRPDAHLFPSGVESRHYTRSRSLRPAQSREHRVAGFVGVVDERLDGPLLAEVAGLLPDWEFRLVGPVADFKMDPGSLPQAPNLHYLGARSYHELPAVMADFDVALMPFALNEATRSISPTKTLEYLAAGLPVVSTPVPDVVADFSGLVHIAGTAWDFAAACERAADEPIEQRDQALRRIGPRYEWDDIAARIHRIMQDALAASAPGADGRASTGETA